MVLQVQGQCDWYESHREPSTLVSLAVLVLTALCFYCELWFLTAALGTAVSQPSSFRQEQQIL